MITLKYTAKLAKLSENKLALIHYRHKLTIDEIFLNLIKGM